MIITGGEVVEFGGSDVMRCQGGMNWRVELLVVGR